MTSVELALALFAVACLAYVAGHYAGRSYQARIENDHRAKAARVVRRLAGGKP